MHLTADTVDVSRNVTVARYLGRTEQTQNARLLITYVNIMCIHMKNKKIMEFENAFQLAVRAG